MGWRDTETEHFDVTDVSVCGCQVPNGMDANKVLEGSGVTSLPKGVPPLSKRWNSKQSFGEFTVSSIAAYINN
jgi:hypothetical protein